MDEQPQMKKRSSIRSILVYAAAAYTTDAVVICLRLMVVICTGMFGCSREPDAASAMKEQLHAEHVTSEIVDGRIRRIVFHQMTDRGLELVGSLSDLEDLSFHQTTVNDEQLCRLSSLSGIRYLNLSWSDDFFAAATGRRGVTDKGIDCILRWDGIQSLDLCRTQITDVGVAKLASLSELRFLKLRDTAVSDAGLIELASLQNLISIDLSNCERIGASGVEAIARLPNLEAIFLHSTGVDDSAVEHLKQSSSLSYIGLSGTQVTDAVLDALSSIRTLERVDVDQTLVTPDAARAFAAENPQVDFRIGSP